MLGSAGSMVAAVAQAEDWRLWRGPSGKAVVANADGLVTNWSETEQVIWSQPLPGRGHSSPCVAGDRIVLETCDEATQTQSVLGLDRATGKMLWQTPINQGGLPKLHPKNTHASSTIASDGTAFYAPFHHHDKIDLIKLDPDGKILWRVDAGPFSPKLYEYGYAASPTIYGSTLIVTANCDRASWMKAFDLQTGKEVWSQEMPRMLVWSSPIVGQVAGKDQLLLSGFEAMSAYDPTNGNQLWTTPCLTLATCGTAVWEGDVVFASGGFPKAETVAVKADGSGQILWKNNVKCYEQSMLVDRGLVYAFSDQGVAYCWEAATGKELWKERLKGPVSASPLLIGDKILATNELGTTWVFQATGEGY
jgi:outer membrane protein assembly factor BamB